MYDVRCTAFLILLAISGLTLAIAAPAKVHLIRIPDVIVSPVIQEYVAKAIRRASDEKAECLIIELDTPGGLLNTTRMMVRDIMNSSVPVVVYVAPGGARAGSAGVFLTLAAHVAVMAPSTNIGAAHPVIMGERGRSWKDLIQELTKYFEEKRRGVEKEIQETPAPAQEEEEEAPDPMSAKVMNDALAWVRAIATERGRNVEWAENSVKKSFSQTEKEALDLRVIDFIARDVNDLVEKLDGREIKLPAGPRTLRTKNASIDRYDLSLRQQILSAISNPNIAFILMLLGFYGLLFEFTHPGFGFPGIGGIICLLLAFYAFQTLPINYAGLLLILLGILLLIAEVKITSYGFLAIGGILTLLLGSLMLIDTSYQFLQISIRVILPFVLATTAITLFLITLVIKAQRRKVTTGMEGLVGQTGTVASDLAPEGYVFISGELWRAKSPEPLEKGAPVRVLKVEHLTLIVEKEKGSSLET